MATSLNGWAAIPSASDSRLRVIAVPGAPGVKVRVRTECAPVFAAALAEVQKHVISLSANPSYVAGYNYRQARAANGFSNHASGTAVDMRWDVWTAAHKQFATSDQIRAMHAILDHFKTTGGKRIFGWGGDWSSNFLDDMHLEIGQAWQPGVGSFVSVADVLNVQKRLRIDANGIIKVAPAVPSPAKPHPVYKIPPFPGAFGHGAHGPYVVAIQKGLNAAGYKLVLDGHLLNQTEACLISWQKKHPKLGKADGRVGPQTYKALAR